MIAVERLLSISGEDTITVDRKYRDPWTGRLPTRFMILTNELPRFSDSSGALASRFVISILTTSFYGRENPALTAELLEEAPGIFNWALEGLDRLRERGYFVTPDVGARRRSAISKTSPRPVGAFVRDLCEVGPASKSTRTALGRLEEMVLPTRAATGRERRRSSLATCARPSPGLTPVRPRDGESVRTSGAESS